jgi:hypothetical protein
MRLRDEKLRKARQYAPPHQSRLPYYALRPHLRLDLFTDEKPLGRTQRRLEAPTRSLRDLIFWSTR